MQLHRFNGENPFFPVVHVFKYICICNLISMYETGMDPGKAGCVCVGGPT